MKIFDLSYHQVSRLNRTLLDKTRQAKATLLVKSTSPALVVVKKLTPYQIVLSLDRDDEITGLFAPRWVLSQYGKMRNLRAPTLQGILEEVAKDPTEIAQGFRHEWLNEDKPVLFVCGEGHYVDACPCREHLGSTCQAE